MANVLIENSTMQNIANAVRTLNGTNNTYKPVQMSSSIINVIPSNIAEGNPLSITDAANYPTEELKVQFDPIQDLHNYSRPWIGGTKKNLINATDITLEAAGDIYNGTINLTAGTYTLSSSNTTVSVTVEGQSGVMPLTFTIASDISAIQIIASDAGTFNNIQIEKGSTATIYEPYANICPISGVTGTKLTQTGKNSFVPGEQKTYTYDNITITSDGNGVYTISGTASEEITCMFNCDEYTFPDGATHTIGFFNTQAVSDNVLFMFYYNNTLIDSWQMNVINRYYFGYYSLSNKLINKYAINIKPNIAINMTISPYVVSGENPITTYEPYDGSTSFSYDFTSTAGTIYSGELDILTGELTSTHILKVMNGATGNKFNYKGSSTLVDQYYYSSTGLSSLGVSKSTWITPEIAKKNQIKCSLSSFNNANELGFYGYIGSTGMTQPRWSFKLSDGIDTVEKANAWLESMYNAGTPLTFVWPLTTPQTYQLTPQQVNMLLKLNNITATNGKIQIKYKTDVSTYIKNLEFYIPEQWKPLEDGWNNFWIDMTNLKTITLKFNQSVANGVTIDWGDGTTTQTVAGTGNKSISHTYTNSDKYILKLKQTSGDLTLGDETNRFIVTEDNSYNYILYYMELLNTTKFASKASFADSFNLKKVILPTTGITAINYTTFCRTKNLIEIDASNTSITTIGQSAFQQAGIQTIKLPDTVTSFASAAFRYCYELRYITIPKNVTSINTYVFNSCSHLTDIYLKPTTPPTLSNNNALSTSYIYHIPYSEDHSILTAYQTAWSAFASTMVEEDTNLWLD